MTEIERKEYHSPVRKAELAAELVKIEERVLKTIAQGLTAARNSMVALSTAEDPSPSRLLQTATSIKTLHGLAKDICGEPEAAPQVVNNVQINSISASEDLVRAVAEAYGSIEQGHLDRAERLIAEAGDEIDAIEAEILDAE